MNGTARNRQRSSAFGRTPDSEGPEEPLQRLAAVATEGVVALRNGLVVWANAQWCEMVGCAGPDAIAGERLAGRFGDAGAKLPEGVGARSGELLLQREDGDTRTLILCLVQRESKGGPAIFAAEDVSLVRGLQEELLELGRELHEKNREVEVVRERLRH